MNNKLRPMLTVFFVLVLAALFYAVPQSGFTQGPELQAAPTRAAPLKPPPPRTGGLLPPLDLSHIKGDRMPEGVKAENLLSRWDWREQGVVTRVQDQGSCGSCYAFASVANFESKLQIDGAGSYDFSENNAKECNWRELNNFEFPPGNPWGSCDGGNYFMLASLFSKEGTVLESCDPYVDRDVSCRTTCSYEKTLLDWRAIAGDVVPDTEVLKAYIQTYGPLFAFVYAGDDDDWETEFGNYDGSYTLYYPGTEDPNHCVLIVGWDDGLSHAGGTGGWIVKNSWGTDWGGTCGYGTERGYFTIAYGSASIGKWASFMYNWQDYDLNGDILYYDEDGGWWSAWGYTNSTIGWGLCEYIPAHDTYVTRVEFWTTDRTTDVDVYLYNDFDGTTLGNLQRSVLNLVFDEAGYYSVVVDPPLAVTHGNDVIAVVQFTNASYQYPIPADSEGPHETGRTFISPDGSDGSWYDLGAGKSEDVAIRLRTSDAVSTPTPTSTPTATSSPTQTRTSTPTRTRTPTLTLTKTPTLTLSKTPTSTSTSIPTPTQTPTLTPPCPRFRSGRWEGGADFTVPDDRSRVVDFEFDAYCPPCPHRRVTAPELSIINCRIEFAASDSGVEIGGHGTFISETEIEGFFGVQTSVCVCSGSWRSFWMPDTTTSTPTATRTPQHIICLPLLVRNYSPSPLTPAPTNTPTLKPPTRTPTATATPTRTPGGEPNLTTSTKTVNLSTAQPGDVLLYTIVLNNTGTASADTSLTDAIPSHTAYVPGSARGGALYNSTLNQIEWTGTVRVGFPVAITFQVVVSAGTPDGTAIVNTAVIDDGVHPLLTRMATTMIPSPVTPTTTPSPTRTRTRTPTVTPTIVTTPTPTVTPSPTCTSTSTPTTTPTAEPTPTPTGEAPKAIVANCVDKSVHIIDATTDTAQGPFLAPLGTGTALLDVVVTPDGRTAIVSNFDGNMIYFIDLSAPTPAVLGSEHIGFSAEDIALSPDGRWALVTDGVESTRIALVDVLNQDCVQTLMGPRAQAVAVAADGETVLVTDTDNDRVHLLHLNPEEAELTYTGQYLRTGDVPINVAISPDGRTALVANFWDDTVTVLRIDGPGDVVRIGEVGGLPGGQQSVAFTPDGSKAYVVSIDPEPDQLSVLNVDGPGDVADSGISIDLSTRTSCGFFGIDCLAVSPDGRKAYVGNPCDQGALVKDEVTVVDLVDHRVMGQIPVGRYPVGIAFFAP